MGWITPIAFLLCHTYSIGDAATLETFSSKSVLSPERGALTGHFRKYLGFACQANSSHLLTLRVIRRRGMRLYGYQFAACRYVGQDGIGALWAGTHTRAGGR